jgi:mono/diheme cytochrome c family protein
MMGALELQAQDGADAKANGIPTDPAAISAGEGIFKANCAQCHAIYEKVVGPKLEAIYERQSIAWLVNFIRYPEKTIKSGDKHAVELYNEYKQYMPNHDFLKEADILNVLAYIQQETKKGPPAPVVKNSTDTANTGSTAAGADSTFLYAIIAGLLVLLMLVLGVVYLLVATLTRYLKQEKDLTEEEVEYLEQKVNIGKILTSQGFVGIASVVFVALALKVVVDGLFAVGVQQGYAPDQPIKFSHKLHAGYYEIDCKYCHTGVEKGKSANIPSANICMNCHNKIKAASPEIQKIYAAIENDEPIQWVRVHNLPDLAYFNHAQHVKVAGIECQTCHGEIEKMEVVQQHSLLTMGWCIDCHRKTDVNHKGNAYYDKLVEMHNSQSKKPMKVENIGGLECSKCHY